MQFGRAFPCILQVICKAEPSLGPIWVSELDVMDVYHCGTLLPSQLNAFTYIILLAPEDDRFIIFDMVLPMVYVDSPN